MIDSDEGALKIARENYKKVKSEFNVQGEAIFMHDDIKNFSEPVDLVVQNPPFGVKVKHADKIFLKKAFEVAKTVYSFHKTESKGFIDKFSTKNGFKITDIFDFDFPLKATYGFHTKRIKRIKVSCFRLEKKVF